METDISKESIGLALSGGGCRAIAFHLGCLRALHHLGVLDRISVLSCVSGGSVIGAMYAYSNDSFAEFDKKVQSLLRRGLQRAIVRHYLWPPRILLCVLTAVTSGVAAIMMSLLRLLVCVLLLPLRLLRMRVSTGALLNRPPLRRWFSRNTVFEAALRGLFAGTKLTRVTCDRRRENAVVWPV